MRELFFYIVFISIFLYIVFVFLTNFVKKRNI